MGRGDRLSPVRVASQPPKIFVNVVHFLAQLMELKCDISST